MRISKSIPILALIGLLVPAAAADVRLPSEMGPAACHLKEAERHDKRGSAPVPRERNDRPIDVRLYELDLLVFAANDSLVGDVQIHFAPSVSTLDSVKFDFSNFGMQVDALWLDGAPANFAHANEILAVALPGGRALGEEAVVRVSYHGRPADELYGFSSFPGGYTRTLLADADGRADQQLPLLASLSEPNAARAWWPCHDTPYDAAQVRLSVRGPASMRLASAGRQESRIEHGDGSATTTWFMPTPIPAYLVSIAMANYQTWSESAQVTSLNGGLSIAMPVQYFANAARRPHAEYSWQNTPAMIEYFDQTISPYPYGDLKYGHALFSFGGAMEHPTMTSMGMLQANLSPSALHGGPSADWIVAHELIHQWYGDSLRLARWGEIWLNEGFASYGEVLWLEHQYGYDIAKRWLIQSKLFSFFAGTVRDPSPERGLFSATIYDKGAWVLHMLRQVLGRDAFLEALRRYADRHRFAVVTTEDFIAVCEEVEREQGGEQLVDDSLSWFFEQWLDREDRPTLRFDWVQSPGNSTRLSVIQSGDVYRLPLRVRVDYADLTSADFEIVIEGANWTGDIVTPKPVRRVALDPDGDWLLNKSTATDAAPGLASLLPAVPNPFNPQVALRFFLASPAQVRIDIYDLRGRLLRKLLDAPQAIDLSQITWDGRDDAGALLASGVYLVRLRTSTGVEQSQLITMLK